MKFGNIFKLFGRKKKKKQADVPSAVSDPTAWPAAGVGMEGDEEAWPAPEVTGQEAAAWPDEGAGWQTPDATAWPDAAAGMETTDGAAWPDEGSGAAEAPPEADSWGSGGEEGGGNDAWPADAPPPEEPPEEEDGKKGKKKKKKPKKEKKKKGEEGEEGGRKKKFPLLLILIPLVVIIAGAAAALLILKPWVPREPKEEQSEIVEEQPPEEEPPEEEPGEEEPSEAPPPAVPAAPAPMDTARAMDHFSSLSPASLGLSGDSMAEYRYYATGKTITVDGIKCREIMVYSVSDRAGTNDIEGRYFLSMDTSKLFRDNGDGGVEELSPSLIGIGAEE